MSWHASMHTWTKEEESKLNRFVGTLFGDVVQIRVVQKIWLTFIINKFSSFSIFGTSEMGSFLNDFILLIKVHIFWEGLKFCRIFTWLLTVCTVVKIKVKISQDFVAFSEYMNFKNRSRQHLFSAPLVLEYWSRYSCFPEYWDL